ncbi:MAG: hypothetical protein Q4C37_01635 [Bacteroidales bacterium]|nr:hypothetical protein [Bacteroidales bacterium]
MKKIIMSIMLAAAVAAPAAINAQQTKTETAQQKTVCTQQKTECANQQCTGEAASCANANDCKNVSKDFKKINKRHAKNVKKGNRRHGAKGEMRERRDNPLFNGITLTEQQQQQFTALRQQRQAAHKEARANKQKEVQANNEARRAERKARAEAYDKEVEKILTPEQYKQYQANKATMDKNKRVRK